MLEKLKKYVNFYLDTLHINWHYTSRTTSNS